MVRIFLLQALLHQLRFFCPSEDGHLPDVVFFLFGLRHSQRLLNFVPLLDFFSSLSLCCVQGIGKLCVSFIDRCVLQASAVCLESHVQWNGITSRILPVGDASWHFPIFLILCGDLPRRTPQNHWRWVIAPSWDLLMLVPWWFQRVLLLSSNLDDPRAC